MEENEAQAAAAEQNASQPDMRQAAAFDLTLVSKSSEAAAPGPDTLNSAESQLNNGTIRTLDGEPASDEMEQDAINYQILLGKIDKLLGRLRLDA